MVPYRGNTDGIHPSIGARDATLDKMLVFVKAH